MCTQVIFLLSTHQPLKPSYWWLSLTFQSWICTQTPQGPLRVRPCCGWFLFFEFLCRESGCPGSGRVGFRQSFSERCWWCTRCWVGLLQRFGSVAKSSKLVRLETLRRQNQWRKSPETSPVLWKVMKFQNATNFGLKQACCCFRLTWRCMVLWRQYRRNELCGCQSCWSEAWPLLGWSCSAYPWSLWSPRRSGRKWSLSLRPPHTWLLAPRLPRPYPC